MLGWQHPLDLQILNSFSSVFLKIIALSFQKIEIPFQGQVTLYIHSFQFYFILFYFIKRNKESTSFINM